MRSLKQIEKDAGRVVAAATGPLGPVPIQRVVSSHFAFFSELKASGASWDQIAVLFEREGLRTRRGLPVSAAVLRTYYARAVNERKASGAMPLKSSPTPLPAAKVSTSPNTPSAASHSARGGSLADSLTRAARLRGILKGPQ